jgi:hypothetical protein
VALTGEQIAEIQQLLSSIGLIVFIGLNKFDEGVYLLVGKDATYGDLA